MKKKKQKKKLEEYTDDEIIDQIEIPDDMIDLDPFDLENSSFEEQLIKQLGLKKNE